MISLGLGDITGSGRKTAKKQRLHEVAMYNKQRRHFINDRAYNRKIALSDRRYAERREASYFKRLAKGAKAAGFHPLSALGVNPSSGSSFVHGANDSFSPSSSGGGYSGASEVSANVSLGGNRVEDAQVENLEASTELLRSQAEASKAKTAIQMLNASQDKPYTEVVNPTRTSHMDMFGGKLQSNPAFSDAEVLESRYGELGGSVLGLMNLPADLYMKAKQYLDEISNDYIRNQDNLPSTRKLTRRGYR
jgi:hypothetical protein